MKKNQQAIKKPYLFMALCVLPAFTLLLIFLIWPAMQVLYASFTNAPLIGQGDGYDFVGVRNFITMFGDRHFIQSLSNTLRLLLVTPIITIFFALLMAFMITQAKLKERALYRTTLFFPSIVSMVVIGVVWSFVFHPTLGILNTFLEAIGFTQFAATPWTGQSSTALWTIAIALIWQGAGYHMVIHIAAIDSISVDIFEAAKIDGAGPVRQMFNITLPMIRNVVGITFIFAVSGTLNHSFPIARVITGGGPAGHSRVLLMYMHEQTFVQANYGYGMAIGAFTLIMAIIIAIISRAVSHSKEA